MEQQGLAWLTLDITAAQNFPDMSFAGLVQ
jgi:hypothetical protein